MLLMRMMKMVFQFGRSWIREYALDTCDEDG